MCLNLPPGRARVADVGFLVSRLQPNLRDFEWLTIARPWYNDRAGRAARLVHRRAHVPRRPPDRYRGATRPAARGLDGAERGGDGAPRRLHRYRQSFRL